MIFCDRIDLVDFIDSKVNTVALVNTVNPTTTFLPVYNSFQKKGG